MIRKKSGSPTQSMDRAKNSITIIGLLTRQLDCQLDGYGCNLRLAEENSALNALLLFFVFILTIYAHWGIADLEIIVGCTSNCCPSHKATRLLPYTGCSTSVVIYVFLTIRNQVSNCNYIQMVRTSAFCLFTFDLLIVGYATLIYYFCQHKR